MASLAKIVLTPNALTPINSNFSVGVTFPGGGFGLIEICQPARYGFQNFAQGTTIQIHIQNLYNALIADYYTVFDKLYITYTATDITITSKTKGLVFTNSSAPNWDAVITPEVTSLNITSITAAAIASGNKNLNARFKINVLDNTGDIDVTSPVTQTTAANAVYFDFARYPVPAADLVINDDVTTVSRKLPRVTIWNAPTVDAVQVSQGSFNVIVNATRQYSGEIDTLLQYSIDGVNFQDSNSFPFTAIGEYTATIIDSCGGVWSTAFELTGYDIAKPNPFFDISRINSLHFSNALGKGFFSRFEDQQFTNIEYQGYAQKFLNTDAPTTQLRANYETITASLRRYCDKVEVGTLQVEKKIQLLSLQDKRDCTIKSNGNGEIYVYFTSGNTYTPDTLDVIGSYTLIDAAGTKLENWMESGNVIALDGAAEGVYYVDRREYVSGIGFVLVVKMVYSGAQYDGKAQQTYNSEDWDIYEFITPFTALDAGKYEVVIEATDTDPRYNDVAWISEPIEIGVWPKTIEIEYSTIDRVIKNITPETGITHKIRVPGRFYDFVPGVENETFKTDAANQVIIRLDNALIFKLETNPLPPYLIDKIINAFKHDTLLINGLRHTFIEQPEIDSLVKQNNPFQLLTANLQYNDASISVDGVGIITGQIGDVVGAGTLNVIGA